MLCSHEKKCYRLTRSDQLPSFHFEQKTSQALENPSENTVEEKNGRRPTNAEDPNIGDAEQINVLKVNKDSEKRPDPRLKKVTLVSLTPNSIDSSIVRIHSNFETRTDDRQSLTEGAR